MTNRPIKIEVLINSPGPHDQVRIREPFLGLAEMGIDCRLHERPFIFNNCIRPHSMVFWQRPLPNSRDLQSQYLGWLRKRGCILLTEWDDHYKLFPEIVRSKLLDLKMAPLQLCHAIHSSSCKLANELKEFNPLVLVLENTIAKVKCINIDKHDENEVRIFIGNQNRTIEHLKIVDELKMWLLEDKRIKLITIGDKDIYREIPRDQLENYNILPYLKYRELLAKCHIALLPLDMNKENECKTPIKLLECAAESVVAISGPGLYHLMKFYNSESYVNTIEDIVPMARYFSQEREQRKFNVLKNFNLINTEFRLSKNLEYRKWLYQKIWDKREHLDVSLIERINKETEFKMNAKDFQN